MGQTLLRFWHSAKKGGRGKTYFIFAIVLQNPFLRMKPIINSFCVLFFLRTTTPCARNQLFSQIFRICTVVHWWFLYGALDSHPFILHRRMLRQSSPEGPPSRCLDRPPFLFLHRRRVVVVKTLRIHAALTFAQPPTTTPLFTSHRPLLVASPLVPFEERWAHSYGRPQTSVGPSRLSNAQTRCPQMVAARALLTVAPSTNPHHRT